MDEKDKSNEENRPHCLTLDELQDQQREWVKRNFPNRTNYHSLLGIVEEVGELCHAHLKHEQGIRGFEDRHKFKAYVEDAIGDIIVFLADYCTANGIGLQKCLEYTWESVKERDWIRDPITGEAIDSKTTNKGDKEE